ncbi:hypothetical protein [Jannaschia sp. R86511]|uniref:hypothetical protein n=1 Tax=Jannaschia sp. R86511 TaxID=3093853 RepID=UPI0036D20A2E
MIGEWELPCIEQVELLESRRLARLGVPGLDGDLHQDLGRQSLTVAITGSLSGAEARTGLLTELQAAFRAGEPLPFVADIVESSELENVVITQFEVTETAEWTDAVRYRVVLHQYVEPPEPPSPFGDLGLDLLDDLMDLAGGLLDGLDLAGLLGGIPALADPSAPLEPALDGVRSATAAVPALLDGLREALGVAGP